jgi:hypothetical protein
MSKISKQVDQQSDSDLSLQLSDASSLTSDSDLSDTQQQPVKKKTATKKKQKKTVKKPTKKSLKNNKKKIKDDSQYCTCRRGYDGKEFMIECDGCQGNKNYIYTPNYKLLLTSHIYRVVSRCMCWP